uniref:Uncharacterized protein n=1 Tax=Acrobeloides nanus TaxID=290746 RepID=A0A914D719_9BILA
MSQSPTIVKRVKPEIVSIEAIPDLKLIYPKAFPDERGFFSETYNMEDWANDLGFKEVIKQ